jgi:hypothetical protein
VAALAQLDDEHLARSPARITALGRKLGLLNAALVGAPDSGDLNELQEATVRRLLAESRDLPDLQMALRQQLAKDPTRRREVERIRYRAMVMDARFRGFARTAAAPTPP